MGDRDVMAFGRPLVYYGRSVLASGALAVAGVAVAAGALPGVPVLAGLCFVLAAGALWVSVAVRRGAFVLLVGPDRIEFRQGVLSREEHVIMTSRVAGVDVLQSFAERSLGVGTVVIGSTGMDAVRCVGIAGPRDVCAAIRRHQPAG